MPDTSKEDEDKFNETLKRMLKTPPDHKNGKGKENDPKAKRPIKRAEKPSK